MTAETETWSGQTFGDGALGFCLGLMARFSASSARTPVRASGETIPSSESTRMGVKLKGATEALEGRGVDGVRALAVASLDGQIEEQLIVDPTIDAELLGEFATLVRIAHHTTADAGSGGLRETTWSTEAGTVLSRSVSGDRFLVLVGGPNLRTSLARYALRQAAIRIDRS